MSVDPREHLILQRFDDLFEEAKRRLRRYSPEWTDFNDSDPGMALVQLFAWFTEQMIFQLEQVPERNYEKFLALLNLTPRPPLPAKALVTFTLDAESEADLVRKGSQVTGEDTQGNQIVFETERDLPLMPFALTDVLVDDGSYRDVSRDNVNGTVYYPFGDNPTTDNALMLGFEYIPPKEGTAPRRFPSNWTLHVFQPELKATTRDADQERRPSARLVWEYLAAPALSGPGRSPVWRQLQATDSTQAFTLDDSWTINSPPELVTTALLPNGPERIWFRCRLAGGGYLPDEVPRILAVRPNTVPARNLVTVNAESLIPTDPDNRRFTLRNKPVDLESLELILEIDLSGDAVRSESCRRVDHFFDPLITSEDLVYTLDPASGEILFGDGKRGRIPATDGRVIAKAYRFGGGTRGNLAANKLTTPPPNIAGVAVSNFRPATNGEDSATIEELRKQAPLFLRSRGQAVSHNDFRVVAESVAGVLRATVRPNVSPEFPGAVVPGAVSIGIVPRYDPRTRRPPVAGGELCERVFRRLDKVRLITTEIHVGEPTYRVVSVTLEIEFAPSVSEHESKERVVREVLAAIRPALPPSDAGNTASNARRRPSPPLVGEDRRFRPASLYRVLSDIADPLGKPLIVAVLRLEVWDENRQPIEDSCALEPYEVLWCDAVEVDVVRRAR